MKQEMFDILNQSFIESGKTKEEIAELLGVQRRTIDNWLSGRCEPSASAFMDWFECLGVNPVPYVYNYYYPTLKSLTPKDNDKRVDLAFKEVSKALTPRQKRIIMVASKRNDSDVECLWELFLCYMQNCKQNKILIATDVVTSYELEGAMHKDTVQPDIKKIKLAIERAKECYMNGNHSYLLKE